jgi:hypothetical protein
MSHENGDDPEDEPKTYRDYQIAKNPRASKPEENDDPMDPAANFDGVGDDDWQDDMAKGLLEDSLADVVAWLREQAAGEGGPDSLAAEKRGPREVKAYVGVDFDALPLPDDAREHVEQAVGADHPAPVVAAEDADVLDLPDADHTVGTDHGVLADDHDDNDAEPGE